MRAPVSLFDRWKDAVQRLPGKCAVRGKVAAIYRQDFRAKCQVGHCDDAGVREIRSKVGKLPQPELKIFGMMRDVEIRDQISVQNHLQKGISRSHQVSCLRQSGSTRQHWHLRIEASCPLVMGIPLHPVGDEKSGVSYLRHDALPVARALVRRFAPRDRTVIPPMEGTKLPSTGGGWSRARLSEADWRAKQVEFAAPRLGEPSRHLQSRRDSFGKVNTWSSAGQAGSAEPVPPEPPRWRKGIVAVVGRASMGLRGGVSPSPIPERGAPFQNERRAAE